MYMPRGGIVMTQSYSDALAGTIADAVCRFSQRHKNELPQRIQDMIEEYHQLPDRSAVDEVSDNIMRMGFFVHHIMAIAIAMAIGMLQDYLEEEHDFDTAYDVMMERARTVWDNKFPGWLKTFQSSVVKRMVGDRKAVRKIIRDLMPALFTPAQIESLEIMAGIQGNALSAIRIMRFVGNLNLLDKK
jgi:uncharacterized protein YutD